MHIDLDYFYAQCEENANPSIRGKPVIVCVYSGRTPESGVVSTSNYQARKFGVKAGMPIIRAKKLLQLEDAVFLPMNRPLYESVSSRIMDIIYENGDAFEKAGIDEVYLDVSSISNGNFERARAIAAELKQQIFQQEHFTCSVGIGPNKLLAKIASDHVKPDGLTTVEIGEIRHFLGGQRVNVIPGIGKKVEKRLSELNVKTIDDLARLDPILLREEFGKSLGNYLFQAARGEDHGKVQDRRMPTQFSRIRTLKENTRDHHIIVPVLVDLARSVYEKMQDEEMTCKTISIIVILIDLTIHTKSVTLEAATDDFQRITESLEGLMSHFLESMPQAILRRIGVRLSSLSKGSGQTNIDSFLRNQ
jgi:DNA polymerase IV (DinB-like DNA polymerase)